MGVTEEVRSIEHEAASLLSRGRRIINKLIVPYRDALALFYKDDQLTPVALRWLDRLAERNFIDRSAWDDDPRKHAFNEGRRQAVIEILEALELDAVKLARIKRQMQEVEHG